MNTPQRYPTANAILSHGPLPAKVARNQLLYFNLSKGTPVTPIIWQWHIGLVSQRSWTSTSGQSGQTIRVKEQDNVQVTNVRVVISDGNGTIYEPNCGLGRVSFRIPVARVFNPPN